MAAIYEIRSQRGHEQEVEGKPAADKIVKALNDAGTAHDGERLKFEAVKVETPKRKK